MLLAINKDWHAPQTAALPPLYDYCKGCPVTVTRLFYTAAPQPLPGDSTTLPLGPAKVALIRFG